MIFQIAKPIVRLLGFIVLVTAIHATNAAPAASFKGFGGGGYGYGGGFGGYGGGFGGGYGGFGYGGGFSPSICCTSLFGGFGGFFG